MNGGVLVGEALAVVPRLARLTARILESASGPCATMTVPQFRLMTRLATDPGVLGALAQGVGVGLASMSQTVEGLVVRGWAERREDPTDRRRRLIALTADGKNALASAEAALVAGMSELFVGLSAQEQAALAVGLEAVGRELDQRWQRLTGARDV